MARSAWCLTLGKGEWDATLDTGFRYFGPQPMSPPTSLQTAIGTILLKAVPQVHDLNNLAATAEHWATVLNALPQGAFDPTLPIKEGGDPWLFHFMAKTLYNDAPGYDFLVQQYGAGILRSRDKAGHTVLEALYAEGQRREQTPKGSSSNKIPMEAMGQIIRLSPTSDLRLPEDGEAPGETWLNRMMNLKGPNVPERYNKYFADQALLEHGLTPNQMVNGVPLAAKIQDKDTLELFLAHGLDVAQSAANPVDPGQTLGELLSARRPDMRGILGKHEPESVSLNEAPTSRAPDFSAGTYGNTQAETLGSLTKNSTWNQTENDFGVPAIWLAMRLTPSVLTVLRKPRQHDAMVEALSHRDSHGRSGWFHCLTQMGGTREVFRNDENVQWLEKILPSENLMTDQGDGMYAQCVDLMEEMKIARGDSSERRHNDPWKISFHSLTPDSIDLFKGLQNRTQEEWWGTEDSQKRLARKLLMQFAKSLHDSPRDWNTEFFSLNNMQGDLNQLHPELVGSLLVINYANRIKNVNEYQKHTEPLQALDKTPFVNYSGRPILANEAAVTIIKKTVMTCLQVKLMNMPEKAGYEVKETQRNEINFRLRNTRDALTKTEPFWRNFISVSAHSPQLNEPVRRARHRP